VCGDISGTVAAVQRNPGGGLSAECQVVIRLDDDAACCLMLHGVNGFWQETL